MVRIFLNLFFIFLMFSLSAVSAILEEKACFARSAYSPRHSGMEPPGEPRKLDMMPGRQVTRTPEGGMGYTDAYGNTVQSRQENEAAPRHRLRSGAYGSHTHNGQGETGNDLPDPQREGKPLWQFY